MKFYFNKPQCKGHSCFADNRVAFAVQRALGRKLLFGERYCLHGPKVRKFKKSDATYYVPGWCPKYKKSPIIRVYTPAPADLIYYLSKNLFGEDWEPPASTREYVLRAAARTPYTPKQFYKKLSTRLCDYMDLLGYNPEKNDVIEIDNGLESAYLLLNKGYRWEQLYSFDKTKCDDGSVGIFTVKPHGNLYDGRFTQASEEYAHYCVGFMRGYFADEERFQGHWQDNNAGLAAPNLWAEHEALLDALKTHGFLRSQSKMMDYCWRFPKGEFPDSRREYGYIVDAEEHNFYIRCLPDAENYNVFIYVYRNNK